MPTSDERRATMWDEVADIGALLHELDDEVFDTPSLCDGWAVRDVLGHMCLGYTTPMPAMLARIGRYAFNVTKASFTESRTLFAGQNPDEIRRFWDEVMVAQHPQLQAERLRAEALRVRHRMDCWRRPTVPGPGEAIVLAAAGRKAALADLEGDGVSMLRQRISA